MERERPTRAESAAAAVLLMERHGSQILATARRYAQTQDDAEDAYQRSLEILLTKAPNTSEDELVPWLKTVVKHEAWALRRQRTRHSPLTDDGVLSEPTTAETATHEQAERRQLLDVGAEAFARIKPQERRALQLQAEGYSYREIQSLTGWTYTKVNRCLTEGKAAFLARVSGIEAGEDCERLEEELRELAGGAASVEALAALRRHLRTCLACRARLRELRGARAA